MKNLTYIVALFFLGWTASASTSKTVLPAAYNYGEAFIFVEGGVEFAVYPNGEFDFYFDPRFANTSIVNISAPRNNISYNAGYNYDAYVQYDDYGAVIQIENIPVFYDYYGRIVQAGNIFINYNNAGLISRVGNLHVQYNRFNQPVRYVGFINHYNQRYVYRPWHRYYVRPHASYRVVYYEPYRAYYEPIRYDYVQFVNYYQTNNYYYNKNNFYRPGQQTVVYNHGRRTAVEREVPALRSSENSTRSRTTATTSVNQVRSSNNTGRRTVESDVAGNSARQAANVERHEAAVRAQRGSTNYNTSARVQTRSSEPANTAARTTRGRVEARETRPASNVNTAVPQQRQSTVTRSSRSSNERSSSVRTPSDTNVRSRNTTPVSREVKPSTRSGNDTRSSRIRG